MKELRFSIQCGASNRKALVVRRCSQCTIDNVNIELDDISSHPQSLHSSHSNRSLSSTSGNLPMTNYLQTSKHRLTLERTSDTDKFDTLLMLAAERTNQSEARRKRSVNERNAHRYQRHFSASPQRKDVPLLLIEQQSSNHVAHVRAHQVRFSSNASGRTFVYIYMFLTMTKHRCLTHF
jgi:hypothetical protein